MSSFDKIKNMDLSTIESPEGADQTKENAVTDAVETETDTQLEEMTENLQEEAPESAQENLQDAEEEPEEKKMMEPQGRHYYFDADFEEKDIVSFVMAHTYRQPSMIFVTLAGIALPIYLLVTHRGSVFIQIAILMLVALYLPISTYARGRASARQNQAYKETFHYMVDEWGLHLELSKDAVDVEWSRVGKMMWLKNMAVLYTGKNNAFLIPFSSLGSRKGEITAFIRRRGN